MVSEGMSTYEHVYVGETARPWRERTLEHAENAEKWLPKSFILDHWMSRHGTSTTMPEFTFKIESSYTDALRRQLMGVIIMKKRWS